MFNHEQKLEEFKSLFTTLEAAIRQGIMDINLDRAKNPNKSKKKEEFTFEEIMAIDSFTFKKKQFCSLSDSELNKADISILTSTTYKTDENTDGDQEEKKRTRGIFYIKKLTKIKSMAVDGLNEDMEPFFRVYVSFNRFKTVLAELDAFIDYEFMDLRRLELIKFIFEGEENISIPKDEMFEKFKSLLDEKTLMLNLIKEKRSVNLKEHMKVSKHRNKRTKKEEV